MPIKKIKKIGIEGFRPFGDFEAELGALEVFVGVNGSGKSSFFEFLKFIRDGMRKDFPPEIIHGSDGKSIFNIYRPEEKIACSLSFDISDVYRTDYDFTIKGPLSDSSLVSEAVSLWNGDLVKSEFLMEFHYTDGSFLMRESMEPDVRIEKAKKGARQFGLNMVNGPKQFGLINATNEKYENLWNLREYINNWKFYSSLNISIGKMSKSVLIGQSPSLSEDGGNLSSVLHFLMTEHPDVFGELQQHIQSIIRGFQSLTVKARGGPGEVMAFWRERGSERELTLADLSDGTLRLLCWLVICLHPGPSTLICIDEPEMGLHPRTLPLLAGLFEKASQRTQVFLATHSSYFLTQFDISMISVLKKEEKDIKHIKPADSKILSSILEDFGPDELESMHRNDELEHLSWK